MKATAAAEHANEPSGVFRKARRMRFTHDILGQIEEAICSGKFREGDKLPSERELCELFQASRGPLREALRVLEQKGLITIRPGARGGAFVRAVTTKTMSESLGFLLRFKGVTLAELAEFRAYLEGVTAALAARRARKNELRELDALLVEARALLQAGVPSFEALLRIDSRFHETLAKASRNRLFLSVLETVYANMYQYQDTYLPRSAKIMRLLVSDLSGIAGAVAAGDADKARELLHRHVYKFNRLAEHAQRNA